MKNFYRNTLNPFGVPSQVLGFYSAWGGVIHVYPLCGYAYELYPYFHYSKTENVAKSSSYSVPLRKAFTHGKYHFNIFPDLETSQEIPFHDASAGRINSFTGNMSVKTGKPTNILKSQPEADNVNNPVQYGEKQSMENRTPKGFNDKQLKNYKI